MTSDPAAPPEPRESVADALARRVRAREGTSANVVVAGLRELGAIDRAVYEAVARTPTGTLDGPVRQLSGAPTSRSCGWASPPRSPWPGAGGAAGPPWKGWSPSG